MTVAPRTVARCDAIRQLLREDGCLTAREVAQRLSLDLALVQRLLRALASQQLVGSDLGPGERALRWHVFTEDEVQVDEQLVQAIQSIPH